MGLRRTIEDIIDEIDMPWTKSITIKEIEAHAGMTVLGFDTFHTQEQMDDCAADLRDYGYKVIEHRRDLIVFS